jgi:molybdopterin molybdotransferase
MAAASDPIQTITHLTPLAEVLATIDSGVKPVDAHALDVTAAAGRTLAADAVAPRRPEVAMALHDGWALAAEDTVGAGGYAPALLTRPPLRVEAGQPMPPGTDSVAPFDAVTMTAGRAEALVTVNPGDGVLPAGGDSDPGLPLRCAGEPITAIQQAAFAIAGIMRVSVREPRLSIVPGRNDPIIATVARAIVRDVERGGGVARIDDGNDLDHALRDGKDDAVVIVGGTGSGRNDASVRTLARDGQLAVHGMALTPGETAAFGFAGSRPVLLLPGRLDAALSVWLVVGRRLLARLAGSGEAEAATKAALTRKVTSTIGLAEVVPVRRTGGGVEPLATKYLPLSALARSDGWMLVPADSEGYAAGSQVEFRPWP